MTGTEAILAAVAGVALFLGVVLAIQVALLRRKLSSVPDDGNVFEALRRLDADLEKVEEVVARLRPVVASLDQRMPGAIRHTAVVSYDAYGDLSGAQSRSVSLLNERGDGLVVTLMVGRQETRFFTKMVKRGRGLEILSPEEQLAVDRAMEG